MKAGLYIYLLLLLSISINALLEDSIIDLIDEKDKDKLPSPDDSEIYYIPIFHSNDIHGSFYPKKILLPNNQEYSVGGLEYMGNYLSIMKEQWGDRLLYTDAGDQFQGGLEGRFEPGNIIMDFFNALNLDKSALGNHEFDFGLPFLNNYMNSSKFDWIIDNIKDINTGKYIVFPHQKKSMIVEVGDLKIKLGIIGLATKETPASTDTHIENLVFEDYVKTINEESKKLKDQGANAIIVLGHIGLYCRNDKNEVKLAYKIRDKEVKQNDCRTTDEAYKLLHALEPGVIDLLLSGHKHDVTHHWINDFPVMSNDRNGKYASIVYLPFNRKTKQLINNKIVFEGPLPICDKVFTNRKICDLAVVTEEEYKEYGDLVNYRFHGKTISKEPNITNVANKYIDQYNNYDKDTLTYNPYHFENSKDYETNMADFYTEFLRQISGADIALLNGGAFRTPFYRGNITNATVHSFDPFGNDFVKFYAYGRDIIKILKQIQAGYKGFYPTAGLKVLLREKPSRKLLSVKLWDGYKEEEIDEDKKYSIVSSEFCFPLEPDEKGGDDFEKVYQWFKPINGEYIRIDNVTNSRDILINYLRNIDELKENKYFDKDNLRWRVVNN